MRVRTAAVSALALALMAPSASAQRQRLSLDPGWRFQRGDVPGAQTPAFDDRAWRRLDLPHDWSIESTPREDAPGGGRVGYFETGIGWYRKTFALPALARGQRLLLEIDGCHMACEVWVNGTSVGRRPNGYVSYAYEITPHVTTALNVIAVRVDNSRQPNSRWYTGSGLYRHVWLTVTDHVRVAHWGTYVTTPRVDSAGAEVLVRTRLENGYPTPRRGMLRTVVADSAGRQVAAAETSYALAAGASVELAQRLRVASPALWSVESPAMYAVRSEVRDSASRSAAVDEVVTPFGIRTIAYDANRGFLLNGRRVKMWGVNLHHDAGGLGAAVPERVWERRLELLRAMGVNAIRTSHNPPAAELMDMADRMGFLVMAEAFDEWTVGKVAEGYHRFFEQWGERDLADYIRRDRNHPSIVLWSAGNEIGEQTRPDGVNVLRRLMAVFRREDPTRPVTTGNDNIAADGNPARVEFLGALDIVGYNYVDRWRERRELMAEQDRLAHPEWRFIGTESGNIFASFDERFSLGDDPARVQPNYNYGMMTAERRLKWVYMRDWFAGDFIWTGIDYLGEATWPFVGFHQVRSTSSATPSPRTGCTRACGRTARCCTCSRTGTGRAARARPFRCWPTPTATSSSCFSTAVR